MKLVEDYIIKANEYINEYGDKTVLLMQVGSFYEIYSPNNNNNKLFNIIYDISEIAGLAVVEKSICVGKEKLLASGFRDYSLDKWLSKMQSNGYTCVVYSQDNNCKNISRSLTGIYTPGTYIQCDSEYSKKNNNNTCIWIEKIRNRICVGISNIDIISGKSNLYEYNIEYKEVPNIYDDIERYISVYDPCEIIIISNLSISLIQSIIHYTNMSSSHINVVDLNDKNDDKTLMAKKCEEQKYVNLLLVKFFNINDINLYIESLKYNETALQSYCYLLNYLNKLNPLLIDTLSQPIVENLTDRLLLANHSSKQLNMIGEGNNKYSSVLNLTNNTITSIGKRYYREILLNPITNPVKLNKYYNTCEKILEGQKYKILRDNLRYIHDIEKLTRLIILSRLPVRSLYTIVSDLQYTNKLAEYTSNFDWLNYLNSNDVKDNVCEIIDLIHTNVDVEICKNMNNIEENIFKRGVYDDLDKINEEYIDTYDILECIVENLDKCMNKELKPKKYTSYVKLQATEKSGYSIQTTKSRVPHLEKIIKNKLFEWQYNSKYTNNSKIFKSTSIMSINKFNNNILIVSDDINILCKKNLSLKTRLKEILNEKYNEFLLNLKTFSKKLYTISSYIGEVDIIQNRAYTAETYNYTKPIIYNNEHSYIDAKSLRHPIIEQINQEEIYVANDIYLNNTNNILLFGTNAVGKTSLIKSIGIAIILAQSGMYVPAKSFEFTPYKDLFTRILNCDNLFKGLSTFTLEMSEMSVILKYANKNSLILGDELCSGTEIPSAMSIFISGLKHLILKESSFIFATHFHELLEFDEIKELTHLKYKHMAIKYDYESKSIIYDRKLKDGSGEKVYGLEVCKSLYLPEEFMNDAFSILNKYYHKDILLNKSSRYNSNKIRDKCEICKINDGVHVHHLLYQKDAKNNFISDERNASVKKNHIANLVNICEDCHTNIHKKDTRMIKQKTTNGNILTIIS